MSSSPRARVAPDLMGRLVGRLCKVKSLFGQTQRETRSCVYTLYTLYTLVCMCTHTHNACNVYYEADGRDNLKINHIHWSNSTLMVWWGWHVSKRRRTRTTRACKQVMSSSVKRIAGNSINFGRRARNAQRIWSTHIVLTRKVYSHLWARIMHLNMNMFIG